MPRLAVLVSGTGTNLASILSAGLPVHLVIADRHCHALQIAADHDIPAKLINRTRFGYRPRAAWDRGGFTRAIAAELEANRIDLVAMAGFMTILGPGIFTQFKGRILNTHPSLLPDFKGAHAVSDALSAAMQRPRVLAINFDGTMFDTFSPSARNISTHTAYDLAIEQTLGAPALRQYQTQGGLSNRSPARVLSDLGIGARSLRQVADELVDRKLEYLIPEIGQSSPDGDIWPKLMPGFSQFWQKSQRLADAGRLVVAIVGSYHLEFLKRTFEVHHLELPAALVSDADLRDQPLQSALGLVAQRLGLPDNSTMVYVGDDAVKDGGMAKQAAVPFIHFKLHQGLA